MVKQSVYMPESMMSELQAEGVRLDRSLAWLVQRCIRKGLPSIREIAADPKVGDEKSSDRAAE
jgi:uncharacterized small protein (TIGR04563 family)